MARQRLGKKKHKKCEDITGKKYEMCLVRGGTEHFWATCTYEDDEGNQKSDWVNYQTGEFELHEEPKEVNGVMKSLIREELGLVDDVFHIIYSNTEEKQFRISDIHINDLDEKIIELFNNNKNIFYVAVTTKENKVIISHTVINGTQLFSEKYKKVAVKCNGMEEIYFGHDGFVFVDIGLPIWECKYDDEDEC